MALTCISLRLSSSSLALRLLVVRLRDVDGVNQDKQLIYRLSCPQTKVQEKSEGLWAEPHPRVDLGLERGMLLDLRAWKVSVALQLRQTQRVLYM